MRNKKLKGMGVLGVILLIAVIGAVGLGAYFVIKYFSGHGNGNGSGSDNIDAPAVTDVSSVVVSETIPVTTIETEIEEYVSITVSGNDYIYQDAKMNLNSIIDEIKKNQNISVKIKDQDASKKAYDSLVENLKANSIHYIDEE